MMPLDLLYTYAILFTLLSFLATPAPADSSNSGLCFKERVSKGCFLPRHRVLRNLWRKSLGWVPYLQTAVTNAMPAPPVKPYRCPHYQLMVDFVNLLRAQQQRQQQEQVKNTQITSLWDGNASVAIVSSIHSFFWCGAWHGEDLSIPWKITGFLPN